MSRRTEKVASLLQQETGAYLMKMELPALTTISKVEVTPDLKWGKIWITVMGDEKQQKAVLNCLHEELFELQGELNRTLEMKIVPRVKFVIDHGEEYASKINELLRKANED
ncbi:MAG: ribosome-binding factor A [Candidatus Doudnabacteria bacterium]|nr:ribosome-binding factor A [Candidatus Doudnabacteria bacterium]